ncbi:MAG: GNAT family N-acetyltransferase [Candidatus Doudnabacteria bacterium]|nr:GNAT family N-acetyltransferase [Candidatus Doudnabacteria bacterium]
MNITIEEYDSSGASAHLIDAAITASYQAAFSGFPWNSQVTAEEAKIQFEKHKRKNGFKCLYAMTIIPTASNNIFSVSEHELLGALWWDCPTENQLLEERGEKLVKFARQKANTLLIWEREIFVRPEYHGNGIGKMLRKSFLEKLPIIYGSFLVLTRMRDDNIPVIKIAEEFGYERTGIKISSSKPGIDHEYWFYKAKE